MLSGGFRELPLSSYVRHTVCTHFRILSAEVKVIVVVKVRVVVREIYEVTLVVGSSRPSYTIRLYTLLTKMGY